MGLERNVDMKAAAELIKSIHDEFKDVFTGMGCLKGTFSLQIREEIKPYLACPRHIVYGLHKLVNDNLDYKTANYYTPKHGQGVKVMQQLHVGTQAQLDKRSSHLTTLTC